MPKILRGLQHIYITEEVREPIFKILEEQVSPETNKSNGLSDFRQSTYNIKQIKNNMRRAQKTRRRNVNAPSIVTENNIIQAHQEYINACNTQLLRVTALLTKIEAIKTLSISDVALAKIIRGYIVHAERQIDQIERRVIHGEIISHNEKVFSIFEPHTEWISKGKAGVPVELGLRVCIMEDQHQFILHHKVMEKETDDKVTEVTFYINKNK